MSSLHQIEAVLGRTAPAIGRHDQEEGAPNPISATLVELIRLLARQAARDHVLAQAVADEGQEPCP